MKKISKILFLCVAVSVFTVANSQAQIIVRMRPHRPRAVVVARPARPSAHHVWVSEEWSPNGKSYTYHAGYWAMPPHPRAVWIAGHWRYHRRGYVWIPGHWS